MRGWRARAGLFAVSGVVACASQSRSVETSSADDAAEMPFDDPSTCLLPEERASLGTDLPLAEQTSGYLDPEAIRATIRSHFPELQGCYELGRGRHRTLRGQVTFRFAIDVEGKVTHLVVADNQLPDCALVECLREDMARIEFAAPEGGSVTVQYPLTFEMAGETPAATPNR
jgi:hypothetical protein